MNNTTVSLLHIALATVIIAAATVLAALHVITGGEAIGMIGTAGGFSLGTAGASASIFAAAANQAPGLKLVHSDSQSSATAEITPITAQQTTTTTN